MAICTAASASSGTVFSTLLAGSGQDYASAVTSDSQGNTYVAGLTYSPDFPVTPGAFQTELGAPSGGQSGLYYPDAFVAKLGPSGNIVWATYLGGLIDDWATGIALDSSGNVWVTGQTRSADFPITPNALQGALDNSASPDNDTYNTFVAELSPDGSRLLYSTFLGNANPNGAAAIAIDSSNNAYLAINATSTTGFQGVQNGSATGGIVITKLNSKGALVYSYFHPSDLVLALTVDSTGAAYVAASNGGFDLYSATPSAGPAVVFKISPDGSTKVYETSFGGSNSATATAIAVDSAGEAWVGGYTQSVDFPLVHPLQSTFGGRPIWESANAGATWTPIDNLPFSLPSVMAVDPVTPTTLYEATGDLGIFKSANGGATWTPSSTGISAKDVPGLAIDPLHTQTLYAATTTTVYKSTNGAASWTAIDTPPFPVSGIEIDGQNTNIVYEVGSGIRKSTDGGATWTSVNFPAVFQSMVLDPRVSGHLIAVSEPYFCGFGCTSNQSPFLWTSADGGNTWSMLTSPPPLNPGLVVDPSTNPSTVYDGLYYRSSDGGVTWTALPAPPFAVSSVNTFAVDPAGNLYVPVIAGPMYVSRDHGQSWTQTGSPTPAWTTGQSGPTIAGIAAAGWGGILYDTVAATGTAGFVTRLSADGSAIEYSTYLDGHTVLVPFFNYASEPNAMVLQNWINGIALDPSGNVIVTGGTRAADFETVNPVQAANAGGSDAFAAILSPDGSRLNYATYFGGSLDDGALAAAIDPSGDVILAGQTFSSDFPITGQFPPHSGIGDAFVTKLVTGPPAISSVVSAASYQPGIESGSWAMIQGVNLANSTRPWQSSDFNGVNLPAALDGVSVTVDGKPAFESYVSPSQINIQAPSDSTAGPVNVVVNNNGAFSQPFSVTLQAAAPAFFMYYGTSDVVATTLNYAPVGDPSVVSGAAPAHPGDLVVLWATGFGATTPPVPAGTLVSGAPATVALPAVTIGGVFAQVISSVLTPDEAGLYQITVQIPAGIPSGEDAVKASIAGFAAPPVTIFIANP